MNNETKQKQNGSSQNTEYIKLKKSQFLTSAAQFTQLPPDIGCEVAFAGRSNAGKSTALNKLTEQKRLARTSKTPGCTQLINFFTVNEQARLVDLPGYGYAKVSHEVKKRWQSTLTQYLEKRQSLQSLVLLTDIRHPLNSYDQSMLEWSFSANLPVIVLLTKADKLSASAAKKAKQSFEQITTRYPQIKETIIFSALNNLGVERARQLVCEYLSC